MDYAFRWHYFVSQSTRQYRASSSMPAMEGPRRYSHAGLDRESDTGPPFLEPGYCIQTFASLIIINIAGLFLIFIVAVCCIL